MKEKQATQPTDQMIHIRFPKDLYEKVKDIAERENRTISNTIITIVKKQLDKK